MPGIYVASSSDQTVKLWEQAKLYKDVVKQSRLNKFMSADGMNIIHEKAIGANEKGDKVTFTLRYRSEQGFLPSRTLVRGNEGNISTATDAVTIDDKNLGLITGVNIDRQRVPYDMDAETRAAIVDDGATSLTQAFMTELFNDTYTTDYLYYASGTMTGTATRATAKAAVTASDKLTPERASQVKRWALFNRSNGRVPLQPVMVDGVPMLVWFVSADVGYDIRTDSTWASAVKDAMERGRSNPLFTGATAFYDGMIFYEDEFVNDENMTNAGAGTDVNASEILICGRQGLIYGRKGLPRISVEGVSHDQQASYAYLSEFGVKKPNYTKTATAKQYGTVNVLVARSKLTDVTVA